MGFSLLRKLFFFIKKKKKAILASKSVTKAFDFQIFKWQVQSVELKSHQKNVGICIHCRDLVVS